MELTDKNIEDVALYSNFGTFASDDQDIFVHYFKTKQDKYRIDYFKLTGKDGEIKFLQKIGKNNEVKLSSHSPNFKLMIVKND
jgi:hypothetical protein